MAKDFEDGVWRTVGGRRIFIKDGQDLASAMKESGKFKNTKKIKVEGYSHKIDEDYEERLAKYKEIQKDANKRYDNGEIDKEERNKLIDDAHDKYIKQKEKSELQKKVAVEKEVTFEEKREYLKQKGIDELNNFTKDDDDTFIRKEYDRQKALEKELKEKYMNIPQEERVKAYEEGKNWKDLVKEKDIESNSNNDKYIEYYKKEKIGKPSNYKEGDKIEFNSGYNETLSGTIVREATDKEKEFQINRNLKGYIVKDKFGNEHVVADTKIKIGNTTLEEAKKQVQESKAKYQEAFNEYKRKHPNTKLNLEDFIKISEGGVGGSK